jgi:hypothetical protein
LTFEEREELMTRAHAILSKEGLSEEGLLEAIMRATGSPDEEAQAGGAAKSNAKA